MYDPNLDASLYHTQRATLEFDEILDLTADAPFSYFIIAKRDNLLHGYLPHAYGDRGVWRRRAAKAMAERRCGSSTTGTVTGAVNSAIGRTRCGVAQRRHRVTERASTFPCASVSASSGGNDTTAGKDTAPVSSEPQPAAAHATAAATASSVEATTRAAGAHGAAGVADARTVRNPTTAAAAAAAAAAATGAGGP